MDILVRPQIISSMCLLLFNLFTAESQAQPAGLFNNGIRGFPNVACGAEKVIIRLDTIRPFKGRVFVKGESHKVECIRSFTQSRPIAVEDGLREHFGLFKRRSESLPKLRLLQQNTADTIPADLSELKNLNGLVSEEPEVDFPALTPIGGAAPFLPTDETIEMSLSLGTCNMRRQRMLVPRGVEYTFTVVVSFHPFFITRVDRAYRVRCFYTETEKLVESQLEVSTLTTHQVNEQRQMPNCLYTLRRDSPDGPLVRYASVGDKIFHVWQCNGNPSVYDILIKNCNVDDGQGTKVQIIDDKGCTSDLRLVSNVQYRAKALSAYTQSSVFKFADKAEVNFQCSIEICLKEEDGCERITPPHCSGENENIVAEIPSFSVDFLGLNRTMQLESGLPYNSASIPRFPFRHSSAIPFPLKPPMSGSTIFPSREVITKKSNRLSTPSISSKLPNGESIRFSLPLRQHDEPLGRDLFKESNGVDASSVNSTGQKMIVSGQENITEHSKITKRATNSSFYHSSQGRPVSFETDITAEPLVILPLNDENQDRRENSAEVEQMMKSGCKEQDVKYSFSIDYAIIIALCGTLLIVSVALAFLFHRIRRSQKISLAS